MASVVDVIQEIRKQSQQIADTWNKNIGDRDLGIVIQEYFENIPKIHTPTQDEWEKFFNDFANDSWDLIKKETQNLGLELLDTITANYKGMVSGYKEWRKNLLSFIGADSFGDIYNRYNEAMFGPLKESKIIINNNEFERDETGISMDSDKFEDKPKDYIMRTNDAVAAAKAISRRTRGRSINEFLNRSVGSLILSGPDLQKNMFDVFLVYHGGEDADEADNTKFVMFCAPTENPIKDEASVNTSDLKLSAPMISLTEDVYMLSVRTQSVEIPGRSRNSANWNWIGAAVDIPSSDWDFKTNSSITVDLDANLYIYDIFNALSGFVRPGVYGSGHYYKEANERPVDKDNLYRVLSPGKVGYEKHTIDLCVPIHKLSTYVDGRVDFTAMRSDILYIFEDVRFLGVGDAITFSNETAATQSIKVPFIFKNIKTVYRTDLNSIQTETDLTAFNSEMQKYIIDHAGDYNGLIKG